MVKEKYLDTTRCTVPYFRPFKEFPTCNTSERIKESLFYYPNAGTSYYPISCQRLSKVLYRTEWHDTVEDFHSNADEFIIGIIYPHYFRSIELSKEVDIHSLIGNVGGYVGLFLGNRSNKMRWPCNIKFWTIKEYDKFIHILKCQYINIIAKMQTYQRFDYSIYMCIYKWFCQGEFGNVINSVILFFGLYLAWIQMD